MAKRVIRLTEADIEYIVRQVIKEQKNFDPLRQRKRKVPKEGKLYNWKGKDNGKLNFKLLGKDIAVGVTEQMFSVRLSRSLPIEIVKPQSTPDIPTLDNYDISGQNLPYADNMVTPDFIKYETAKTIFNNIVTEFVSYIEAGGGPKLTNVTIKGSADSARPTTQIPSGYSSLDHPGGTPYGGETDPMKMNQYLADTRASEYAKVLKESIKEKTGFDLPIKVLPGDNYYGKGDSFRGEQYRKITLTPNAPDLEILQPSGVDGGSKGELTSKREKLEIHINGQSQLIDGYVYYSKNKQITAVDSSLISDLIPSKNAMGVEESKIRENNFYINNQLFGEMKNVSDTRIDFYTPGFNTNMVVGPTTMAWQTSVNIMVDGKEVNVTPIANYYILFGEG